MVLKKAGVVALGALLLAAPAAAQSYLNVTGASIAGTTDAIRVVNAAREGTDGKAFFAEVFTTSNVNRNVLVERTQPGSFTVSQLPQQLLTPSGVVTPFTFSLTWPDLTTVAAGGSQVTHLVSTAGMQNGSPDLRATVYSSNQPYRVELQSPTGTASAPPFGSAGGTLQVSKTSEANCISSDSTHPLGLIIGGQVGYLDACHTTGSTTLARNLAYAWVQLGSAGLSANLEIGKKFVNGLNPCGITDYLRSTVMDVSPNGRYFAVGLNLSQSPILSGFSVPYDRIALVDDNQNIVYQKYIQLPGPPGQTFQLETERVFVTDDGVVFIFAQDPVFPSSYLLAITPDGSIYQAPLVPTSGFYLRGVFTIRGQHLVSLQTSGAAQTLIFDVAQRIFVSLSPTRIHPGILGAGFLNLAEVGKYYGLSDIGQLRIR